VEVSTTAVAVVAADSEDSVDLEAEVSAVVEPAEVGKNKSLYSIKKDDGREYRLSSFLWNKVRSYQTNTSQE
jgi:hypothetical protein